jgi:molybdenum cofactor guanylyltransferase
MIDPAKTAGMILAGGRSSRMGFDKALLPFGGKTFIERIAAEMLLVLPSVAIVSGDTGRFDHLGLPVIADVYENCGPLGGLHAALTASSTSHVLLMTCDTPLVNSVLLIRLLTGSSPGEITICSDGDRIHPLAGIYPRSLLANLDRAIKSGVRRVTDVLRSEKFRILAFPDLDATLQNINTPEEYAILLLSQEQSGKQ